MAQGRYEAWLAKRFAGLPEDVIKVATEKWMKIREWHLSERKVWRALYKWSCMRTAVGQQNALDALRKAYADRNNRLDAAEKAHYALSPFTGKRVRRACSREVYDMLVRHPGWYPPRH
jgi:hypothetical protein